MAGPRSAAWFGFLLLQLLCAGWSPLAGGLGAQLRMVAGPAASLAAPRRRFPGLEAGRFRHPLDEATTRAVQRSVLGALEPMVRSSAVPFLEEVVYFDNLANSVRVGPSQLPDLHASLLEAAGILDVAAPDLYVRQNPQPNAYTLAVRGAKPFIVVHSSLLDLMTPAEVQAVLAHELGHLKCEHGVWLTLANLAQVGLEQVPLLGDLLGAAGQRALLEWRRAAEFSCDRASLLVVQDKATVVSALLKLVGGAASQALSAEAFLEQAKTYDQAVRNASLPVRRTVDMALAPRTHPLPVTRVAELDRWASSPEFHGILARGTQQPGRGAPQREGS